MQPSSPLPTLADRSATAVRTPNKRAFNGFEPINRVVPIKEAHRAAKRTARPRNGSSNGRLAPLPPLASGRRMAALRLAPQSQPQSRVDAPLPPPTMAIDASLSSSSSSTDGVSDHAADWKPLSDHVARVVSDSESDDNHYDAAGPEFHEVGDGRLVVSMPGTTLDGIMFDRRPTVAITAGKLGDGAFLLPNRSMEICTWLLVTDPETGKATLERVHTTVGMLYHLNLVTKSNVREVSEHAGEAYALASIKVQDVKKTGGGFAYCGSTTVGIAFKPSWSPAMLYAVLARLTNRECHHMSIFAPDQDGARPASGPLRGTPLPCSGPAAWQTLAQLGVGPDSFLSAVVDKSE
jgi:hypothetical protein